MALREWAVSVYTVVIVAVSVRQTTSHDCPVWFDYNEAHGLCLCSASIEGYITCSQKTNSTFLHLGMALGYDSNRTDGKGPAIVADIPYVYPNRLVNSRLEINLGSTPPLEARKYLCGNISRTRNMPKYLFCGKCDKDYGPALYSFGIQCAKCSVWWGVFQYFALQIFPISIFYAAVLIFKIDLTRPNIFHYVIFCNLITVVFRYSSYLTMNYLYSGGKMLPNLMRVALTMSGVWCLDFFRFVVPPFCISENLHDSTIPFFDFFPAAYLLILTLVITGLVKLHSYKIKVILWLWRPFHKLLIRCRQNRDPLEALTHTYATFFFLYFFKTIFVALLTAIISSALSPNCTKPIKRLTVFYDPTTKYFELHHITIVMIVFVTAAILIAPAAVLLVVFHTSIFQMFYRAKIGHKCQLILQIFVHTLQNGYKDGSQSTRDFRPMVGWLLIGMIGMSGILMILARQIKHSQDIQWPIGCAFFTLLAIVYGTLRPYKKRSANNVAIVMYGLLVVLANLICFISQRAEELYHSQREALLTILIILINAVNFVYLFYFTIKIITYFVKREQALEFVGIVFQKCRCPCKRFRNNEEEQSLLQSPGPPSNYH